MFMYRLPKRQRQALALLFAAIAATGIGALVVVPVAAKVSALHDAVVQERAVLGRLLDVTARRQAEPDVATASDVLQQSGLLVGGASASIRQAALQSELSALVAAQGLKIRSAHALAPRSRGALKLIGNQLQIAAPMAELQKLIIALETHRPALFIDTLSLVRANASGLPGDDDAHELDARFDIYAVAAEK